MKTPKSKILNPKSAILLTLLILTTASCVSVKKQRSRAHEFFREHPEELAALCADRFPPSIEYKPGIPIIKHDTVTVPGDSIPCPEVINPDTGQKETPMVKCPDCKSVTEYQTRTDTVFVANTAREEQFRLRSDRLQAERDLAILKEEEAIAKAKKRFWYIIGLIALIGLYTFGRFRRLLP